ncbi:MAG: DnaB-like helicase C-terminal domain-containing protein [Dehalococcoidia bacterium]|nr:DnaB-like helicase C-terminal domain-containing protein [Dehalococcoidia bacterium]
MIEAVDRILASVFYRSSDQQDQATKNALHLKAHRNIFLEEIDKKLWGLTQTYLLKERKAPSEVILRSLAENAMASDVVGRLEILHSLPVCDETDFLHFLDDAYRNIRKSECSQILATAAQILAGNYRPGRGEEKLEGTRDAIHYFLGKGINFLHEDSRGRKLRGDIRKDGAEMIKAYEKVEKNPGESVGILTGFDTIDLQTHGIRRGELWILGGFASDGKTTTCLNIAHQAVCKGFNVMLASMEMSRDQVREILYAIHTGCSIFRNIHPAIPLGDIRRGRLTPEQKDFYFRHVIPDFETNPQYGILEVTQPDRVWSAEVLQAEAEVLHKRIPNGLDLIIPDYVGLMGVEGKSDGRNEDLNRVIRGLKQMALTFGGGDSVAVLSPFQCNREGRKRADANEGQYDLQALSSAHEAERSSDVVLTIYMNEAFKANKTAVLCQLKGRDTGNAPPRLVHADLVNRIIQENAPSSTALESSNWMDNLMVGI